jgi:hypothetical protein
MRLKNAGVGARESIFRQVRDRLEQRRADGVIEIAAGEGLLSEAAEPGVHLAHELVIDRGSGHYDATSRKVA